MYKRILLGFDGSEPSNNALEHAVKIAEKLGSRLLLISVAPRFRIPIFPDEGFEVTSIDVAQEYDEYQTKMSEYYKEALQKAVKGIRDTSDLEVESILESGRPSSTIVRVAEEREVDLIILGSRGLGGITGWILGSTSRRVVESCTKPVLIVK
jgi:nucleotide-binding universal stress UspA family protein